MLKIIKILDKDKTPRENKREFLGALISYEVNFKEGNNLELRGFTSEGVQFSIFTTPVMAVEEYDVLITVSTRNTIYIFEKI